MSCIIIPRDGPLLVVPLTLASRWSMVYDCLTELKEGAVEIPLSGDEAQVWLDLDQRMTSRFIFQDNVGPRSVPPLLDSTTLMKVVNYLNPQTEEWRLHYIPPANQVKEEVYVKLGLLLIGEKISCGGMYGEIFSKLEGEARTDDAEKRMILRAILYCDWMRNGTFPLTWGEIDWKSTSTLQLHQAFWVSMGRVRPNNMPDGLLIALGGVYLSHEGECYSPQDKTVDALTPDDDSAPIFWERIMKYIVTQVLLGSTLATAWFTVTGINKIASIDFVHSKTEPSNKLAAITLQMCRGTLKTTQRQRELLGQALAFHHKCVDNILMRAMKPM